MARCLAAEAELWAVLDGLHMARSLNFKHIILEADSTRVNYCLTVSTSADTCISPLIQEPFGKTMGNAGASRLQGRESTGRCTC